MDLCGSVFLVLLALVSQAICNRDANRYSAKLEDSIGFRESLQGIRNEVTEAVNDPMVMKSLFENFIQRYNRVYITPAEREKRLRIFAENLKRYEEMNKADMGTAVYGVDQFSDISVEEFKRKYLMSEPNIPQDVTHAIYDGPELIKKPPKAFDWRTKGVVTPVKYQRPGCSAGWAFSASAVIESAYAIKYNETFDLSEQQIVDCDSKSMGCKGGWAKDAIKYVIQAGGLESTLAYRYRGIVQNCSFNASAVIAKVKSLEILPQNEKKMMAYLHSKGPISVHIDPSAMMGYGGGISHPSESMCKKDGAYASHALAIVGYGVAEFKDGRKKKKIPYWIMKNSWNKRFGDQGYYYLYRGDKSCGITNFPCSAVIA